MSAAPARSPRRERAALDPKQVVSDVDLRGLRVRGKALELALLVRHEAFKQGTLQPAVSNVRAARELGVTVRTIQRAKRQLEDKGVVLLERRSRHVGERGSENLAHRYQLDRRALEALHPQRPALRLVGTDGRQGVTDETPPIGTSKPLEEESPSGSPPPLRGRTALLARDGPPGERRPREELCETEAVGSALPADATSSGPADRPAQAQPSLTGWRSALPEHVAAWMRDVGPHYADDRRAFVAECERLPRFDATAKQVEGYRQHLLRELDHQLGLEGEDPSTRAAATD